MDAPDKTYHIIGGGIAGLACVWLLRKQEQQAHIALYEAQEYVGGRAVIAEKRNEKELNFNRILRIISSQDNFMSLFVKPEEWKYNFCFFDAVSDKIETNVRENMEYFYKIIGGDSSKNLDLHILKRIKKIICKNIFSHNKLWLSNKDLDSRVCNLLASAADDVFYGWCLREIIEEGEKIIKLRFNTQTVKIGQKDKIIFALDNHSCQKFLDVEKLPHYSIANIVYQTSETIFLPGGVSFVGLKNSEAECIVSEDNFVIAVVLNCPLEKKKHDELAQRIWLQIDKIRGVNSAFMPAYKIIFNKNAVVKNDEETNKLRPKDAQTCYKNAFIAGDWTMRDYPCRMETAVESAKRAVKAAID